MLRDRREAGGGRAERGPVHRAGGVLEVGERDALARVRPVGLQYPVPTGFRDSSRVPPSPATVPPNARSQTSGMRVNGAGFEATYPPSRRTQVRSPVTRTVRRTGPAASVTCICVVGRPPGAYARPTRSTSVAGLTSAASLGMRTLLVPGSP